MTWVGHAGLSALDPLDVGCIHPSDGKAIGNWTSASSDDLVGRKPEHSVLGRCSSACNIWLARRSTRVARIIVGIIAAVVLDHPGHCKTP